MKRLTIKQELFCQEYQVEFNGRQAAIAAGYSKRTAHVIASQNLRKPLIMARLKELVQQVKKKVEVEVKKEMKKVVKPAVSEIKMPEMRQEIIDGKVATQVQIEKAAINAEYVRQKLVRIIELSIPTQTDRMGRPLKAKLGDANRALELLGRHIGFFEKDNMQQGQVGVPEVEKLSVEMRSALQEALSEYLGSQEDGSTVGADAGPDDGERVTH